MSKTTKTTENGVNKEEVLAALVKTGMTVEDAEAKYREMFDNGNANATLPFELLKVNNVAGVADMGKLVGKAEKDDDGEVISYGIIFDFADIEVTIITKKAMYNSFDPATSQTTVKTILDDTFVGKSSFVDVISGKTISTLVNEGVDCKYQVLAVIGVRERGSDEPFTPYCIYLKGAVLFGFNRLFDTYRSEAAYSIADVATKIGKNGAVRFTEIDLSKSEIRPFNTSDTLGNLGLLMSSNEAFEEYVAEYNTFVTKGRGVDVAETEAGLPE